MSRAERPRLPVLGRLERAVLDALWERGAADVVAVHQRVGAPRGLARSTIHSTLERLVRKQLAARRKRGRAYEYRASLTRGEWLRRSLAVLVEETPGADAALLMSAFVDLAESDSSLDALEALVRRRRRESEGEGA